VTHNSNGGFDNDFRDQQVQTFEREAGRACFSATASSMRVSREFTGRKGGRHFSNDPMDLQVVTPILNTEAEDSVTQTSAASPTKQKRRSKRSSAGVSHRAQGIAQRNISAAIPCGSRHGHCGRDLYNNDKSSQNYIGQGSRLPYIDALGTLPSLDLSIESRLGNPIGGAACGRAGCSLRTSRTSVNYPFVPGLYGTIGAETANPRLPRFFGGRI